MMDTVSPDNIKVLNDKINRIPLLSKNNNNIGELEDLKERVEKLKLVLESKDKFIRDLGDSKDEDVRELENCKLKYSEFVEQHKAKVAYFTTEIDSLKSDLTIERFANKKLINDLKLCQDSLDAEKSNEIKNSSFGDASNSLADNVKVCTLQSKLGILEKDLRTCIDENFVLREKLDQVQTALEENVNELKNLNEINATLRTNFRESQEKVLELEAEIHSLKVNPQIARQGNSLFGEVIEGRENQEKEMEQLFREKERFRKLYDKSLKLLHENTMKAEVPFKKESLSAPTLAAFKRTMKRLKFAQHENQRFNERLHVLEEELLSRDLKDLSVNPRMNSERRLQDLILKDDLRSKQRYDMRIRDLEMENHDLLEKILAESSRASSIPQLEHRIENLSKIIAQYEKNNLTNK